MLFRQTLLPSLLYLYYVIDIMRVLILIDLEVQFYYSDFKRPSLFREARFYLILHCDKLGRQTEIEAKACLEKDARSV